MKRLLLTIFIVFIFSQNGLGQNKLTYGITGGLNLSTAILPDLTLNTNINSILQGDAVAEGTPQLADFVSLYKAGVFLRLEGRILTGKLGLIYDKTRIYKTVDAGVFRVNALDIDLSYLDLDISMNLNLLKNFYISLGYVPAYLLKHEGNLNVNDLDQRILTGIGFKFNNGMTLDFNAIIGLTEVIDGSYIHNVNIPITLSIPFN